jgi:uncharacterized peroxidase-related enzyme
MSEMLKLGLKMIEEEEATGELADLYETAKRQLQTPKVPNSIKAAGISVGVLKTYLHMLEGFEKHISLPRSLVSMICFAIARKNECLYCSSIHELTCRTLGVDENTLVALAENLGEVSPERIRAIIEFALKTGKDPQSLEPEDYERLRLMGISNDEIVQIIFVAAMGTFSDILADSIKIDVDQGVAQALGRGNS